MDLQSESNQQLLSFQKQLRQERVEHKKELEKLSLDFKEELENFKTASYAHFKADLDNLRRDSTTDSARVTFFEKHSHPHKSVPSGSSSTSSFKRHGSTTTTESTKPSFVPSSPFTSHSTSKESTSKPPHKPHFSTSSPYTTRVSASPTPPHDPSSHPSIDINDRRNIMFSYEGDKYVLQDKDFIRHAPKLLGPLDEDDGLSLYSQIQRNALVYNILVTDIEEINKWTMEKGSAPPTYPIHYLDPDFHSLAYQRSATALYTKISNIDFSKVPVFQQFVNYESQTQDGYRVLYAILSIIHPNIVERSKMEEPSFSEHPNLFNYIRHYRNWLEFERVCSRTYSPIEQLTTVLNEMDKSGKYNKAVSSIRMNLQFHQKMSESSPHTPFPSNLLLDQLPYTIINQYQQHERLTLFESTNLDDHDNDYPVINRFNAFRKITEIHI